MSLGKDSPDTKHREKFDALIVPTSIPNLVYVVRPEDGSKFVVETTRSSVNNSLSSSVGSSAPYRNNFDGINWKNENN